MLLYSFRYKSSPSSCIGIRIAFSKSTLFKRRLLIVIFVVLPHQNKAQRQSRRLMLKKKLSQGQSEKDCFCVIPDFLVNFYFTLGHMVSSFLEKFNSQSFLLDWLCIKMSKKSRLTHIEPIGYTLSVILFSYIIYLKSSGLFSIKSSTKYSFPCV